MSYVLYHLRILYMVDTNGYYSIIFICLKNVVSVLNKDGFEIKTFRSTYCRSFFVLTMFIRFGFGTT